MILNLLGVKNIIILVAISLLSAALFIVKQRADNLSETVLIQEMEINRQKTRISQMEQERKLIIKWKTDNEEIIKQSNEILSDIQQNNQDNSISPLIRSYIERLSK